MSELSIDHQRQCPGCLLEMPFDFLPALPITSIDDDASTSEGRDQQSEREEDQAGAQGKKPQAEPP